MQKIIIKNLHVVKDFEMEINKFNLIIGEQSSGKSTISKAIYFFYDLRVQLKLFVYQNLHNFNIKQFSFILINHFNDLFGITDENLYVKFEYKENIYIEIINKNGNIEINYSENIINFVNNLIKTLFISNNSNIINNINLQTIQVLDKTIGIEIENFFEDDSMIYYLPASRSIISLLNNQKTRLNYHIMDFINAIFMQHIEMMQTLFNNGINTLLNKLQDENLKIIINNMNKKVIKYLKGEYFYNDGNSYFLLENTNKKISVNKISSGQQEMLWILYALLAITAIDNKKPFIIIEEPEAHLYPKMQKEIVDFIVNFMNMTNSNILITTHSPYILTSTNNLLYAGKLKENYKDNKEKIEIINNVVGEYGAINPNEINAFKLYLNDFRYTNIINDENEINCEEIDDVSNTINETYTKLFDMELNNEQ
ncbi:ATP-binding protein [Brachyspira pulli]|uniref:AAA family ATPase n=1 Tax=Brachyspira pulli TaxID=310721 RepID=UPI003006494C